ncbi:hypothetical protein Trydic_g14167 [Trypoxylus dichotomus]
MYTAKKDAFPKLLLPRQVATSDPESSTLHRPKTPIVCKPPSPGPSTQYLEREAPQRDRKEDSRTNTSIALAGSSDPSPRTKIVRAKTRRLQKTIKSGLKKS